MGLNSINRIKITEEGACEFETRSVEIIQNEQQRKNILKKLEPQGAISKGLIFVLLEFQKKRGKSVVQKKYLKKNS